MNTKKYMMIPRLLLSVFSTACQNHSDETEHEVPEDTTEDTPDQTSEGTTEEQSDEQNIDEEKKEHEAEETETKDGKEEGTAEKDEIRKKVIDRAEELESYEALIDLEGSVDGAP